MLCTLFKLMLCYHVSVDLNCDSLTQAQATAMADDACRGARSLAGDPAAADRLRFGRQHAAALGANDGVLVYVFRRAASVRGPCQESSSAA